jgi:hypothetical protein
MKRNYFIKIIKIGFLLNFICLIACTYEGKRVSGPHEELIEEPHKKVMDSLKIEGYVFYKKFNEITLEHSNKIGDAELIVDPVYGELKTDTSINLVSLHPLMNVPSYKFYKKVNDTYVWTLLDDEDGLLLQRTIEVVKSDVKITFHYPIVADFEYLNYVDFDYFDGVSHHYTTTDDFFLDYQTINSESDLSDTSKFEMMR